jgi:uncharacterized protein (TIRG00374 family)
VIGKDEFWLPGYEAFKNFFMESKFSILIKKYWLLFFFVIVFFFMAIFKISLRDMWMALSSLRLWQFGLLLFVYLLISLFLILTRKFLLYSLLSPSKFRNLVFIHFSSMTAHYSTPAKLGFPFTVYLLKRLEEIPYSTGTAVVIIELIVSTGICGVIAVFGSYFYFDHETNSILPLFLLFVTCALAVHTAGFILRKKALNSRLYRFIKKGYEPFKRLNKQNSSLYIITRFSIQILSGINLVLLAHFFSADLSLWQAVTAGSTAFFLGALSMVPMGLGVREASVLFYLHHVGIPNEVGLSIVTIQRLLSTGLSFALGTILGAILGLRNINANSV